MPLPLNLPNGFGITCTGLANALSTHGTRIAKEKGEERQLLSKVLIALAVFFFRLANSVITPPRHDPETLSTALEFIAKVLGYRIVIMKADEEE